MWEKPSAMQPMTDLKL